MNKIIYYISIYVLMFCTSGCQEARLRERTDRLSASVTDLYYQQTLNNLAMMHADPGRLPYLGVPNQGTATIQNALQATYTPNWDLITASGRFFGHYFNDKSTAAFQGSTQTAETWQTQPTTTPEKLALMKFAYLRTLGRGDPNADSFLELFRSTYYSPFGFLEALTPGWYCVGSKHEMPKHVSHYGHYGKTYVWVMPEHTEGLSRFVLAIMDIATAAPKQGTTFFPNPQAAATAQQGQNLADQALTEVTQRSGENKDAPAVKQKLKDISQSFNINALNPAAGLQDTDELIKFLDKRGVDLDNEPAIVRHLQGIRSSFETLKTMPLSVPQTYSLIQPRSTWPSPYPAPPVAPPVP